MTDEAFKHYVNLGLNAAVLAWFTLLVLGWLGRSAGWTWHTIRAGWEDPEIRKAKQRAERQATDWRGGGFGHPGDPERNP